MGVTEWLRSVQATLFEVAAAVLRLLQKVMTRRMHDAEREFVALLASQCNASGHPLH